MRSIAGKTAAATSAARVLRLVAAWVTVAAGAAAAFAGEAPPPPQSKSPPTQPPPFRYIDATAYHVLPQTHNSESGYFSLCEGLDGRVYVGTAKYGENSYLVEFDPATARQRIVLFGGSRNARPFGALNDTWLWDGRAWTESRP